MAKRTFKDRMTIGKGSDQIDLYYFGPGHTNGDAWVVFPAHRIVHSGDIFAGKSVPLIDSQRRQHASDSRDADPGAQRYQGRGRHHQRPHTGADDLGGPEGVRGVQPGPRGMDGERGLKAGKTPEQLAAEWKVPEKYKGYSSTVSQLMGGMAGRIQALQKEPR